MLLFKLQNMSFFREIVEDNYNEDIDLLQMELIIEYNLTTFILDHSDILWKDPKLS